MQQIQTDARKKVVFAKEADYGEKPVGNGKALRRTSDGFGLKLSQEGIQSKEVRNDMQTSIGRPGFRKVEGSIKGEVSGGSYADFWAAVLRKGWVSVPAVQGVDVTFAGNKITRAAGSWLESQIVEGLIIQLSALTGDLAQINGVSLMVLGVTAQDLYVDKLDLPAGTSAGATVSVPGKVCYTPETGHTKDSFTFEEFDEDVNRISLFTGVRVTKAKVSQKPNAMAETEFTVMGRDREELEARAYPTPDDAPLTAPMASTSGMMVINRNKTVICTGFDVEADIDGATGQVVGTNFSPDVFTGTLKVSGNVSVYDADKTLDECFVKGTPVPFVSKLDDGMGNAISICIPYCLLSDGSRSGEREKVQQFKYTAGKNPNSHSVIARTTMFIQDTSL